LLRTSSPVLARHRERCHVIPLGIPTEDFNRCDPSAAAVRQRYGDRLIVSVETAGLTQRLRVLDSRHDPDLRNSFGQAVRLRAKQEFGLDVMTARTLSVYDQITPAQH
jgi:hypothetical protein